MIWTVSEIADAVWAYPSRTVDGQVPAASNGSPLDNIAYAVWTYGTRTASGGVATFSISIAQTMPAPAQDATAGTSMPVSVAETLPTPSQSSTLQTAINCIIVESLPAPTQTITAEAIEIFTVAVAESLPAPSQAAVAGFTPGANPRVLNGPRGAWLYYPPIYAIKTKGRQEAPAPGQRGTLAASARIEPAKPLRKVERRPSFMVRGTQSALTPGQAARVRSHRAIRDRDKEEADILMLISSF